MYGLSSILPDVLLLRMIEIQKVFFDKNSYEQNTGRVRNKYKLSGQCLKPLDIYTFFCITTNEEACSRHSTIEVEQRHWENKASGFLDRDKSYIDAKKVELLTKSEVVGKIRDVQNGFKCVARLCDEKFNELKEKKAGLNMGGFISTERRLLAEQALSDIVDIDVVNNDILEKLGLN